MEVNHKFSFNSDFLFLFTPWLFSTATNVEIELPVPSDATTPNVRTSMGSSVYAPEKEELLWKIKSFPGGKVCYLLHLFASLVMAICNVC